MEWLYLRNWSWNNVAVLTTLVAAVILAALPLAGSARGDSGVCGPFESDDAEAAVQCNEPGLSPGGDDALVGATGALDGLAGMDVPSGTEIVPLPVSVSIDGGAAGARENEALLALPKQADGTVPNNFRLAPGAQIADSFFSPVLCSTIARIIGEDGGRNGPKGLVVELPEGAAVFPHSVYQMAASELVPITAAAAADALASEREVSVEAPRAARADAAVPRPDPYREFQYGLSSVEIERAWTVGDGTGSTIAVLDSLPDGAHVDLPGFTVALASPAAASPGADAEVPIEAVSLAERKPGIHGTLMAGVIAARTSNGVGISGIAPGATLLSVPVCAADGPEDCGLYDILRGIDVAWQQSADIVNLSLVGPSNVLLERAVARLERLGVLVVAAAGNEGTREPRYPAAYPSVIGVGAVDRERKPFERSNRGLSVEVMAPGVGVLSTIPGDSFAFASGTSLAAAHVSGSLAVLLSAQTEPEAARSALISGSVPASDGTPIATSLCNALHRLDRSCR